MTDEQFAKMHALELAKLAMLQGIHISLQNIAMQQKQAGSYNWKDIEKLLGSASALVKPPTAPLPPP